MTEQPGEAAERRVWGGLGAEARHALEDGLAPADPGRQRGSGYCTGLALGMRAEVDGRTVGLGDGGFTTWTAQLLGDRKERCLISCMATERLAGLSR